MKRRNLRNLALSQLAALALALAACAPGVGVQNEPLGEEPIGVREAGIAEGTQVEQIPPLTGNYGITDLDSGMMLASVLLDRDIYSQAGEEIGEVQDLLIDATTGNVLFAKLEHGGFPDIGDQEIMVPLGELLWGAHSQDAFTLNVDQQAFRNWTELGEGWPNAANAGWDDEVTSFWNNAGVDLAWDSSTQINNMLWASQLINTGFDFGKGADTAIVQDLVIDLAQGQARYALVAAEEGLFGDDNLRAVPFTALNVTSGAGTFAIEPTLEPSIIASAPAVVPNTFEFEGVTLFGDEWDDDLANYWADRDYLVDSGPGDQAIGRMGATGVVGADNVMMLATAILDQEVGNIIDGDLGEIEDIYIDASSGTVLFATVEHGGFLDIGDEDFPVPMTALTWNAAEAKLVLPITEDLLESFPAIENDWETTLEPGWREVSEFWRNSQFDTSFLDQANLNSVMRASDLVGYRVGAYNAAGIANVQDLIINLGNSKVQYAVLSFLDADTYGIEHVIVPFSAFDPAAFGNELVFAENFNMSLLNNAPRVAEGGFDGVDTLDPTWDDGFAGYWEEAGFGADAS